MDRRKVAIAMLAVAALAPSTLGAQPSAHPRRIGALSYANPVAGRAYRAVLTDELAKLGWIDGQNVRLIYRLADGDASRLPALAAELVSLEPDVLFSPNAAGSLALAHATSRVPVVINGSHFAEA